MILTTRQLEILLHTLGVKTDRREPCRNHYVAGPGHYAMPDLEALEQAGMMKRVCTPVFCDQSNIVFCCTVEGRKYALERLPEPPVLPKNKSKYRDYADNSECYDSFAAYLGINKPKCEHKRSHDPERRRFYSSYRMIRNDYDEYGACGCVAGEWMLTKKAAKASYKAALAKSKGK